MESSAFAIILAVLAVVITLIVGGFYVGGGWGAIMIGVGTLGAVIWLIGLFQIASAMNSDI